MWDTLPRRVGGLFRDLLIILPGYVMCLILSDPEKPSSLPSLLGHKFTRTFGRFYNYNVSRNTYKFLYFTSKRRRGIVVSSDIMSTQVNSSSRIQEPSNFGLLRPDGQTPPYEECLVKLLQRNIECLLLNQFLSLLKLPTLREYYHRVKGVRSS